MPSRHSPSSSSFFSTTPAPPIISSLASSSQASSELFSLTFLRSEQGGTTISAIGDSLLSAAIPPLYSLGTLLSSTRGTTVSPSNITSSSSSSQDPQQQNSSLIDDSVSTLALAAFPSASAFSLPLFATSSSPSRFDIANCNHFGPLTANPNNINSQIVSF